MFANVIKLVSHAVNLSRFFGRLFQSKHTFRLKFCDSLWKATKIEYRVRSVKLMFRRFSTRVFQHFAMRIQNILIFFNAYSHGFRRVKIRDQNQK